ncbi:hypothetical protein BUALT_Bualt06G0096900 [Buddleja alternifolia]|uniref:Protein kinase domain-containing protein n=1 Tax=Buddleja alternifolia TaxID=168488 RepID=A0AAV6XDZ7_9LAMI|nr:hypothetical protein BUALT_Bualt06G0096900 [Buddleja alternifolia]
MSRNYDNWERLVAAVLKREELWQLFHQDSLSSSFSSVSSDSSFRSSHDVNLQEARENSISEPIDPKLIFLGGSGHGFRLKVTLKFKEELENDKNKGTFGTTKIAEFLKNVKVSNKEFVAKGTKVVTKLMYEVRVTEEEFKQQMKALGNCSGHENVGAPRAYYFSNKPNKAFVVYDYRSRGSVSAMLHDGNARNNGHLSWKSRRKIAIGAARGIAHIHTQCGGKLAHGNIKSSNVFLNSQQYGCVSDFGFAGILVKPPTRSALRYPPPPLPYYSRNPSQEYDVHNFGLMLLELLTGVSPMDAKGFDKDQNFETWVLSIKPEDRTSKLFDRRLRKLIYNENDLIGMMQTEIPGLDPAVLLVKDSVDIDSEALRVILHSRFHSMARVPTDYFPVQDLSEMVEMLHVAMKCLSENTLIKMSDVVFMLENKVPDTDSDGKPQLAQNYHRDKQRDAFRIFRLGRS